MANQIHNARVRHSKHKKHHVATQDVMSAIETTPVTRIMGKPTTNMTSLFDNIFDYGSTALNKGLEFANSPFGKAAITAGEDIIMGLLVPNPKPEFTEGPIVLDRQ